MLLDKTDFLTINRLFEKNLLTDIGRRDICNLPKLKEMKKLTEKKLGEIYKD